eukprot:TRINITY_DN10443_c0_g1_i1.p3 TRINITY_DN10443_c0_g1~~TRINITY_DN10443_c0_g1_i1.p3  ORF type:complete len:119 (+),score=16.48 TRINITY_DN10443_c0_g1_i1:510-866(+)
MSASAKRNSLVVVGKAAALDRLLPFLRPSGEQALRSPKFCFFEEARMLCTMSIGHGEHTKRKREFGRSVGCVAQLTARSSRHAPFATQNVVRSPARFALCNGANINLQGGCCGDRYSG